MGESNGVIKIGRKGRKKFAFGEEGEPFEVDVVVAFQEWLRIDDSFRVENDQGERSIDIGQMAQYHQAAVEFVSGLSRNVSSDPRHQPPPSYSITTAEALDFLARLREQYDELADFFRPRSRREPESPDTSEVDLQFSAEPTEN